MPPRTGKGSDEMLDRSRSVRGYERSPEDLLRLLLTAFTAIWVVVVVKLLAEVIGGFQANLVDLIAVSSADLLRVLEGLLQLIYGAVALITLLLPLVTRRLRIFAYVLTVDILCGLLMGVVDSWIDLGGASNAAAVAAGVEAGPLPDATTVAQVAASIVVFSPFVTRRWRQVLLAMFACLVVLQLLVSVYSPAATAVALALGPAVGSATLLLYGRPLSRPTVEAIAESLRSCGLEVATVEGAAVDARGSTPYIVTLADGSKLFTKVLGASERAADLLFRVYRRLRLKNVGDERPDSSLRRTVEHEALVSLKARDVGIATPRLRSLARVGQDAFLLAYDLIPGTSLDNVEPQRLTDDVLSAIWEQVALLRVNRIAHRDLRLANLFLDDTGHPLLIDFGFAEVAADEAMLRADVAQLLASLTVAVGVQRALTSAIAGIGTEAVGSSIGRLQVVALSGATQNALKSRPGLLDELRTEVARRCGVDEPKLEPLTRFRPSNGALLASAAVLVFVGLPAIAGPREVWEVISVADWSHLLGLVAAAAGIEVLTAWGFSSSTPMPLPAIPTVLSSVGSVFASTTAPSRQGGTSLRARFLERHGSDPSSASSTIAFYAAVNGAAYLTLLVAFLIWAGRSAFDSAEMESPEALVAGLLVVVALAAAPFAFGQVRRHAAGSLRAHLKPARRGLDQLAGSPSRLASSVVAAVLAALVHIWALQAAGEVFDFDLDVDTVGIVYLLAAMVATIVLTPGHIVALEVALTAGLVAAGAPLATAVPTVLLYRIATFWLPFVAGAAAVAWLRRHDHV